MAYTKLISQHTREAGVEEIVRGEAYRLSIPAGSPDKYRLAQLDDYAKAPRNQLPWRAPASLSLSARVSKEWLPGTWGFGFWNDPFGLSLGFGGTGWRLPALPSAAWFFHASKENYLSFGSPRAERNKVKTKRALQTEFPFEASNLGVNRASTSSGVTNAPPSAQREVAGNGFLAQVFRSPRFHPLLLPAGLALPFSGKTTRRLLGRVIGEDSLDLRENALENAQYTELDLTQWHSYQLDWRESEVAFEVDGVQVFESPVSPRPPLGLVIWIDNQYAAFTPEGKIGFGVLENPEPAWLEVKEIDVV